MSDLDTAEPADGAEGPDSIGDVVDAEAVADGDDGSGTGGPETQDVDAGPLLCGPEGEPCPAGETCELLPGGHGVCLEEYCDTDADCTVRAPDPAEACCITHDDRVERCRLALDGWCAPQDAPPGTECAPGRDVCDPEEARCAPVSAGRSRCRERCSVDVECSNSGQCLSAAYSGPERVCRAGPAEEGALGVSCAAEGIGACPEGAECMSLGRVSRTTTSLCMRACESAEDCPHDWWCAESETIGGGWCLPKDGAVEEGGSCAADPFACEEGLVCVMAGTTTATCLPECGACSEGERCGQGLFDWPFHASPFQGCVAEGTAQVGTSCMKDPANACGEGFCNTFREPPSCGVFCNTGVEESACPAPFTCSQSGDNPGYCIKETGSGAEVGAPCAAQGQSGCGEGLRCDGAAGTARCRRPCGSSPNAVCPPGSWCQWSVCVPAGPGGPGEPCPDGAGDCERGLQCLGLVGDTPRCYRRCRLDAQCPDGETCHLLQELRVGICGPPGGGGQGASCASDPRACSDDHICGGSAESARCLTRCDGDTSCPDGSWCSETPLGDHGVACIPEGSGEQGASCASAPWSCAEGLHCVQTRTAGSDDPAGSWARCLAPCGTPHGGCDDGRSCRYVGGGRAYCLETGDAGPGEPCTEGPEACSDGTLCLPTSEGPRCLVPCLPGVECPEGTSCEEAGPGQLHYCTTPDLDRTARVAPPW